MTKRGRPRSPKAESATIVNVKMRLYPEEDADLIEFFASIPRRLRAGMVKQALIQEDELWEPLEPLVD